MSVMKSIWFLEQSTVSHDNGPSPRNSVTSLTIFFVPSTRLEWFEKANLPIRHLPFVSRSRTVSGALYMLIISLMLPLSQRELPFFERMFSRTIWRDVQCTVRLTLSMDIINCSCELAIFRSLRSAPRAVCCGNGW